ncbi:MAG TPA: hypothetical protein VHV10_02810 [Ktedonobacteraceae bacterium]|jgi:hypothetical protein|nr:hypothetical protein [Ktedonobacteraceae bacterium]
MDNDQIRMLWLDDELEEVPIPEESLPKKLKGKKVNLIIRSLSADNAGDILDTCTRKDGTTDQKKLMFMMLAATVRNADDPHKSLVWNTSFMKPLLKTNVAPFVAIAQQSIKLSGLNVQLDAEKKDFDPMIVDGSLSDSPETSKE